MEKRKALSSKKKKKANLTVPVTVTPRNAHIPEKLSITKKDWYLQ